MKKTQKKYESTKNNFFFSISKKIWKIVQIKKKNFLKFVKKIWNVVFLKSEKQWKIWNNVQPIHNCQIPFSVEFFNYLRNSVSQTIKLTINWVTVPGGLTFPFPKKLFHQKISKFKNQKPRPFPDCFPIEKGEKLVIIVFRFHSKRPLLQTVLPFKNS